MRKLLVVTEVCDEFRGRPAPRRRRAPPRPDTPLHTPSPDRKVDVRLPGKGNSHSKGARPVHLIITMKKWIRTSRLSRQERRPAPPRRRAPPRPDTPLHTPSPDRKVDVRLPGKGNCARPVHLIITMIKWIRTSGLSLKNSLSSAKALPSAPRCSTAYSVT